jgi:hypothetical protein
MNNKKYNNLCDIHFNYDINDKYNINFYNDNNNQNFIILEDKNNKTLTCEYKILGTYDKKNKYFMLGNDMKFIDKNMIDKNIKIKKNKLIEINNIENQIISQLFLNHYIGFVKKIKDNIIYYFLIIKIIKL